MPLHQVWIGIETGKSISQRRNSHSGRKTIFLMKLVLKITETKLELLSNMRLKKKK